MFPFTRWHGQVHLTSDDGCSQRLPATVMSIAMLLLTTSRPCTAGNGGGNRPQSYNSYAHQLLWKAHVLHVHFGAVSISYYIYRGGVGRSIALPAAPSLLWWYNL